MKKLTLSIIALIAAINALAASYDFKYGDFYYKITDTENKYVTLVAPPNGEKYAVDTLKVPRSATGNGVKYSVSAIGDAAFMYNPSLRFIESLHYCREIGVGAFYGCKELIGANLQSVNTIGTQAFASSSLVYASMLGVRTIGEQAFRDCSYLAIMSWGNSFETYYKNSFEGCGTITYIFSISSKAPTCLNSSGQISTSRPKICVPTDIVSSWKNSSDTWLSACEMTDRFKADVNFGSQTKQADFILRPGTSGFNYYNLAMNATLDGVDEGFTTSKIVVPDYVDMSSKNDRALAFMIQAIGDKGFYGGFTTSVGASKTYYIEEVSLSSHIQNVGYGAIPAIQLKKITFRDGNPYMYLDSEGALFNGPKNRIIVYPGGLGKKSYTVPATVKTIGAYAFSGCTNLKVITLPDNLEYISDCAFSGCWDLYSIAIPEGVKYIFQGAFMSCQNLITVKLPSTVQNIAEKAFQTSSDNITDVYCYASTVPVVYSNTFDSKTLKATLHVPVGTLDAYKARVGWRDFYRILDDLEVQQNIREDVNGDGEVNSLDALKVYKYMQAH